MYVGAVSSAHLDKIKFYGSKQFAKSTRDGQSTAVNRHYLPWCANHGLDPIIKTGDPLRGGRCASLLVDLVLEVSFGTSITYLWYIREWMQEPAQGGQMDPLEGVYNWDSWIVGVEVETWVPSEPRQEVPFEVLAATVNNANHSNIHDVLTVLIILVLWFTCSRTEFPLTKVKSSFDRKKHCRMRDVKLGPEGSSWMMGTIKQDRKGSRPGMTVHDGDTVARKESLVGRVEGVFDLNFWIELYISLRKQSGTWTPDHAAWLESPFFVDENGECFTYDAALNHWRFMMVRAGVEAAHKYAFHGLRVGAYNAGRETEDPTLIVDTGDWGSGEHARYGRRRRNKVLNFASDMVHVADASRLNVLNHSQSMISVAGNAISEGGLPPLPVQALLESRLAVVPADAAVPATSKGLPLGCTKTEYTNPKTGCITYIFKAPDTGRRFWSLKSLLKHTSFLNTSALDTDLDVVLSSQAPGSSKDHGKIASLVSKRASLSPKPCVVSRRSSAVSQRASTPLIAKSPSKKKAAKLRLNKLLEIN